MKGVTKLLEVIGISSWGFMLKELGFRDYSFVETVVSTYSGNIKNFAPIGVVKKGRNLYLKLFKITKTYRNISENKECVINVVSDVEIFYLALFKEKLGVNKRFPNFFLPSLTVDAPRVKGADAYVEAEAENFKTLTNGKVEVKLRIKFVEIVNPRPKVFCRCDFAVIESLIHLTRIPVFVSQKRWVEAEKLIKLIEYYKELVERVCPKSEHIKIMGKVAEENEQWKKKIAG